MSRFDYVKYDETAQDQQAKFKEQFTRLEELITHPQHGHKPGRAQSLALTKLEEVYMWVGKMIRDEQIERNGSAPLQEERKNDESHFATRAAIASGLEPLTRTSG